MDNKRNNGDWVVLILMLNLIVQIVMAIVTFSWIFVIGAIISLLVIGGIEFVAGLEGRPSDRSDEECWF